MIKEFDKLAITSENVKGMSWEEQKRRAKEREQLLSKMTNEELNELLKRPYPSQYKAKIRKFLK